MSNNGHPQSTIASLGLRVGPFQYIFFAYCRWGVNILRRLELHLETKDVRVADGADRCIHLVAGPAGEFPTLPRRGQLAEDLCRPDWKCRKNRINTLWLADQSRHVIWTETAVAGLGEPRFEFPWSLLLMDITSRGGGLIHAGLACHAGSGLLFLAPPSGGKTTTLSTAPADWQVLSDDAALVWPDEAGRWLASPLPAWGLVTNPGRQWCSEPMDLDRPCALKSLLVLQKSPSLSLTRLTESSAMPHLYRALSEYPVTIISGDVMAEPWFRAAAGICRALSCWELSLPRHADIWPLVAREAA